MPSHQVRKSIILDLDGQAVLQYWTMLRIGPMTGPFSSKLDTLWLTINALSCSLQKRSHSVEILWCRNAAWERRPTLIRRAMQTPETPKAPKGIAQIPSDAQRGRRLKIRVGPLMGKPPWWHAGDTGARHDSPLHLGKRTTSSALSNNEHGWLQFLLWRSQCMGLYPQRGSSILMLAPRMYQAWPHVGTLFCFTAGRCL